MSLRTEMLQLVRALDESHIAYALCGGLAMAVHGWPRATLDIDVLIEEGQLDKARRLARSLGFTHEPGNLVLAEGRVRICRMVKFAGAEYFPLDFLSVTPALLPAWASRTQMATADGPIVVVSSSGLVLMKSLRHSGTDQDDIRKLKGETDERG